MRSVEERNALALANRWLVPWTCKRLLRSLRNLSLDEAISEGYASLLKAAAAFDPERGQFSTLAVRAIRRDVLAADFEGGPIRLPRWLMSRNSKGHRLQTAAEHCRTVASLDGLPGHEPPVTDPEGSACREDLLAALEQALATLPAADRELLRARYWERRPLRELGRELKITQEAVRLRQQRALERLRGAMTAESGSGA